MEHVDPKNVTLKLRLETQGRGGKAVTVLYQLPNNSAYFEALTKTLKVRCGSGGTFKEGQIEIQGDHREKIKLLLEKMGFKIVPS